MYEIDKPQFGKFVAELRKEKGFTQKDVAERLYLSDKAVSKWETGASLPDTALLIPLSELLGVSVTELLMYRRLAPSDVIEPEQVETIVKTAITYQDRVERAYEKRSVWHFVFVLALLVCAAELFLLRHVLSPMESPTLLTTLLLSAFFGAYFCFFATTKLPRFYDENRISFFSDGIIRMNLAGVHFNNRNWPHILRACRVWAVSALTLYPLLSFATARWLTPHFQMAELVLCLAVTLGALFLPVYILGRKYE